MADFVTKSLGSIQAYVVGAPPEAMALFILAVALTVALLVHRVIRRDGRSSSSRAKRPVRPTAADWLELLSPALCGLVALSVFVGALSVGGFYDPKLDGAGLDFLRSAAGPGKAPDAAY